MLLPEVPRALLAMRGWRGAWARSFGFAFGDYMALHPHVTDATAQQVQRAHKLGRRLHAWAVNDPADYLQLRDCGADGIITDDPRAARIALEGGS
jgi:glycerophosphoryl diester phosphodiesterase